MNRLPHTETRQTIFLPLLTSVLLVACSTGKSRELQAEPTAAEQTGVETTTPILAESKPVLRDIALKPKMLLIESPIAPKTFGERTATPVEIDTVVVHFASAIYWFDPSFQKLLAENPELGKEGREHAAKIGLTPENLVNHKYDWQLVKAIFEIYGVSSHYAITRDGVVIRFVPDSKKAYHAGQSKMPTADARTGVNEFSIGIELLASHPSDDPTVKTPEDAYTPAQYQALQYLMRRLCAEHGINYVVGHDEIAPGRKNDPGPLFQWDQIRNTDYSPTGCDGAVGINPQHNTRD